MQKSEEKETEKMWKNEKAMSQKTCFREEKETEKMWKMKIRKSNVTEN